VDRVVIEEHPRLDAATFTTAFGEPLGAVPSPDWLVAMLKPDAPVPMHSNDDVRKAVRDLLRHGGYKPTGRGKPASEYLVRAAGENGIPSINAAVDCCNVVSLHSGLPISVVDLDLARAPLRIGIAASGSEYVFNPTGQTIGLDGLLCLFDVEGPCANGVKDAQRTKTHAGTVRTLTVIWGTSALPGRCAEALSWYRRILERLGADVRVDRDPERER
jgi:DNA/RNA-binding domain of Phe-tRNA-synthetase-like protein